ncbi:hypothetical protein MPER_11067 [Moniliophthora perniciosa FA553]|nr:hypothetical protein MPER_11067 [Moniliophthora perniciosa FA553]
MTPTSIHARTDGQPIEMVFSPSTTPVPTHTQIAVARQRPVEEPNYPSATDFVPPQIPPLVAPQPRRVGVDRTIIDPRSLQEYEQVPMQVISPPEEYRWSSNNSFPNWTGTDTEGATGMAVDGDRTVMPVYEFSEASSGVGRQSFEVGGSWNPVMQAQDWPISQ